MLGGQVSEVFIVLMAAKLYESRGTESKESCQLHHRVVPYGSGLLSLQLGSELANYFSITSLSRYS
jgi:hypothetical protein